MPNDADVDLFNRAEADLRSLQTTLQLNFNQLLTIFLLILAKDIGVPLPDAFTQLTTNYASFLAGSGDLNDEKSAISSYLGRVSTDINTFQYTLVTKIAAARAIATIQPIITVPLPAAPYTAPLPRKPNPFTPTASPSPTPTPTPAPTPPPSVPTPAVAISTSVPAGGVINVAITLAATASITGDTLTGTQFKVNGTNQGSAATGGTPSTTWTPTTKGAYSITATATGSQGGTATSATKTIQVFDTKIIGGGAGVGTSLGAIAQDFILFDNNQSAGGNAATMNIFVGGIQVAAFNYTDTAYAGKPFAYYDSANLLLHTDTIKGTVNF